MNKQATNRLKNALSVKKRIFSCAFLTDVLCSFRKTQDFAVMERCFKCPHYERFNREMQEEEDAFFEEVERIRKHGYPKRVG